MKAHQIGAFCLVIPLLVMCGRGTDNLAQKAKVSLEKSEEESRKKELKEFEQCTTLNALISEKTYQEMRERKLKHCFEEHGNPFNQDR